MGTARAVFSYHRGNPANGGRDEFPNVAHDWRDGNRAVTLMGGALAEQPTPVRVRGQIEKVDGNTLTVKAREGAQLTIGCRTMSAS